MRLTRYTDYGLRVLMYLGVQSGRLATITEVAEAYQVSRNHLVKVVNELGRLGFLRTVRGKGGGIRLAKAPEQIRVGAVVRAMEENLDIIDCAGADCPIMGPCRLRTAVGEALEAFMGVLDRYTLADLLAEREGLRDLLVEEVAAC